MSEQTAKPYLVRAIYEWCGDQGYTPYLAVRVNGATRVPQAFVKNGEIVLNVSASATRHLKIDNEWIQFSARFNGVSHEVSVPMAAVAGIFARETGYGFAFNPQPETAASGAPPAEAGGRQPAGQVLPLAPLAPPAPAAGPSALAPAGDSAAPTRPGPDDDKPRGRPNLQVVK
jgi:stringent starvation protein B